MGISDASGRERGSTTPTAHWYSHAFENCVVTLRKLVLWRDIAVVYLNLFWPQDYAEFAVTSSPALRCNPFLYKMSCNRLTNHLLSVFMTSLCQGFIHSCVNVELCGSSDSLKAVSTNWPLHCILSFLITLLKHWFLTI